MPRTLFCRHERCGETVDVVAGQFPAICPGCGKDSKWSTTPGNIVKERRTTPRVPYDLTYHDRRLLRAAKILRD
jgi:hypothetical protein